jgi:hypothetical protein
MGWTGIENDGLRRDAREHIARGIGAETERRTLAAKRIGGVIYGAYWGEDDKIIGLVLLLEQHNGWTHYKAMTEAEGPAEAGCPADILSLLDETDEEYAIAWRERCRQKLLADNDYRRRTLALRTA